MREATRRKAEQVEAEAVAFAEAWHADLDVSINNLADHLVMPVRTVQRFLGIQGNTWHAILTTVRVKKARELLTTTTKRIDAIAYEVGYRDRVTFVRNYHDKYGQTPSETRKEARVGTR